MINPAICFCSPKQRPKARYYEIIKSVTLVSHISALLCTFFHIMNGLLLPLQSHHFCTNLRTMNRMSHNVSTQRRNRASPLRSPTLRWRSFSSSFKIFLLTVSSPNLSSFYIPLRYTYLVLLLYSRVVKRLSHLLLYAVNDNHPL